MTSTRSDGTTRTSLRLLPDLPELQLPAPVHRLVLTALLVAVALPTASLTLWDHGLLLGPPAMNGSARGTALVVLVLGVPLVAVAGWLARRDRPAWSAAAAGGVAYLAYNAGLLTFATPFNRLFLLYVALLGLSAWTLLLWVLELVRQPVEPGRWSRPVAGWIAVVTAANLGLWLASIVPAVLGDQPEQVTAGLGVATNPVYAQDLALALPAAAVVALGLWRRRPWSTTAGAALTTFWVLESVSVAVDQWLSAAADPTSNVVSADLVPGFLVLAATGCVPAALLLRTAGLAAGSRP